MKQGFKRLLWSFCLDPFIFPLICGIALILALFPLLGANNCSFAVLLWCLLIAVAEHLTYKGIPVPWAKRLTPNFLSVRDMFGCWRIFQIPVPITDCKAYLRELLEDQRRLPAALSVGSYRTLTHDTILKRLQKMDNVELLSVKPAYSSPLSSTINNATKRRCAHCSDACPFRGLNKPRQFYEVRFQIKK